MGFVDRIQKSFREWVRTWNHCECCNAEAGSKERFYAVGGSWLCRACMDAPCMHEDILSPNAHWVHRVGLS